MHSLWQSLASKNNRVVVLLVLVIVLQILVLLTLNSKERLQEEPILKLSEIRVPMIDSEAAMVVVEKCASLPSSLWIFLLFAYLGLLVFNLSFTWAKASRPQWGWEVVLTAVFLVGWVIWDECREQSWFPLEILEMGLTLYALYLLLWEKKEGREK